jgi:hypothetical protein
MLYVVLEQCPFGCSDVVLVAENQSGKLFAFCPACGSGWLDPTDVRNGTTESQIRDVPAFAPTGIRLPSEFELKREGMEPAVVKMINESDWPWNLGEINKWIRGEPDYT